MTTTWLRIMGSQSVQRRSMSMHALGHPRSHAELHLQYFKSPWEQ